MTKTGGKHVMAKAKPGVTRADIVKGALLWNGWGNGSGYPGKSPNPILKKLGRPLEFCCADSCSFWYAYITTKRWSTRGLKKGLPLPAMQPGIAHGFAYVPDGLNYAKTHKATRHSWQAEPADFLCINTGQGSQPGHIEMVTKVVGKGEGIIVYSIAGDSGPSNIDDYRGQGGVHEHEWSCPEGKGNDSIMAVIDPSKLPGVVFGKPGTKPPKKAPTPTQKAPTGKVTKTELHITAKDRTLLNKIAALLAKLTGGTK